MILLRVVQLLSLLLLKLLHQLVNVTLVVPIVNREHATLTVRCGTRPIALVLLHMLSVAWMVLIVVLSTSIHHVEFIIFVALSSH